MVDNRLCKKLVTVEGVLPLELMMVRGHLGGAYGHTDFGLDSLQRLLPKISTHEYIIILTLLDIF